MIQRGDYVVCKPVVEGEPIHAGLVIRAAKDGSWADVRWRGEWKGKPDERSKRMRTEILEVVG